MRKLNLGCGQNIIENFINVDILPFAGVDVIVNMEAGLPFKDNSFDYLFVKDSLEHVGNIVQLFEEIYRILKPKGILHFIVPYYTALSAYQHLTHKTFFTHNTMMHFSESEKGGWEIGTKARFQHAYIIYHYYEGAEEFCKKLGITLEEGRTYLNNIIDTIEWQLIAKK